LAEFKNPNQQGGQDNRSLLVTMLVMAGVIFGVQYYHTKTNPQTVAPSSTQSATQSAPAPQIPAAAPHAAPNVPATAASGPTVQAAAEAATVVENELYRIEFTNRGAQVRSWILKRYKDSDGKPLDLVHADAATKFGYPMSLYTYDGSSASIASASRNGQLVTLTISGNLPADVNGRTVAVNGVADNSYNGTYVVTQTGPNTLTYAQAGDNSSSTGGTLSTVNGSMGERLSQAMYVASATGALAAPATLSFNYEAGALTVRKTFSFDQSYVLHVDTLVTQNGAPVRALVAWPVGFNGIAARSSRGSAGGPTEQLDSMQNGKETHLAAAKVSGGSTLNGPLDWGGISDLYFGAIFMPDSPQTAMLVSTSNPVKVKISDTKTTTMPYIGAALGDLSGHTQTRLYAGPKLLDVLKKVHATGDNGDNGPTLEKLVDFGFFGFIGKYLFLALQYIHDHIASNWGWAIIVLTVVINIVLLPLRVQTMKSAVKMQRIQPQINAIKAKYKNPKMNDPKTAEMNAEIMKFQKDNGVNVLGGCIPSLVQMPLLIAFFQMLTHVVELRQAHWLWLPDLSLADPTHILPIVMVISMFIVQFYTPSPGVDPQQQKMMAFMMPLVTGYFVWNYASGLGLYWAAGNLINIAQQAVMNRTGIGREMRELAAKRARRKGTTIQGKR